MPDYSDQIKKLQAKIAELTPNRSAAGVSTILNVLNQQLLRLQNEQKTSNYETEAMNRYKELSDPKSSYYQIFSKNLQQQLGKTLEKTSPTTQNLLALSLASGASFGTASKMANEQRKAIEAQNRDVISRTSSQATGDLFLNMSSQAGQSLGMGANIDQFRQNLALQYAQLEEQRRQFTESQSGFGDFLGGTLGFLGGQFLSPITGKLSGNLTNSLFGSGGSSGIGSLGKGLASTRWGK